MGVVNMAMKSNPFAASTAPGTLKIRSHHLDTIENAVALVGTIEHGAQLNAVRCLHRVGTLKMRSHYWGFALFVSNVNDAAWLPLKLGSLYWVSR